MSAAQPRIDREIYLPRCWTDDAARCAAAGIPEQVRFATKIALARRMLARALDAGVPAAWATADEFYGGDRGLRRDLQARGIGLFDLVHLGLGADGHTASLVPGDPVWRWPTGWSPLPAPTRDIDA